MKLRTVLLGCITASMLPMAMAQQSDNQQEILLDVLLAAYNGGAQTYAEKTNTEAHLLSKQELDKLNTQIKQLQVLVTDENGQIDMEKVNAMLNLASQSDYEFMGVKASSLQEPLQILENVSDKSDDWQEALLELKEKNQPLIKRTLNELSQGQDEQGTQNMANVLSILVGAGMAIDEMAKDDPTQAARSQELSDEVNYLKALAEKDMPALLHTNIEHQFDALVSKLKIAYADKSVGEQTQANTQNIIKTIEHFLSQAKGQLTQTQYEELLFWLKKLDKPYDNVRQQVMNQHAELTGVRKK